MYIDFNDIAIELDASVRHITSAACMHLSGILENGIALADNPTPYIKIGKDKIDFGKSYNPDLIEMSGLIFPNFYKEYGNIVYRYGSNLKCSFWNKTLDYVGLMPPSVPDNIQLYNLIYPRFV